MSASRSNYILFLSITNHARTQIAEGLARHFLGYENDVMSAGTNPSQRIHPMAVAVMAEIGIDISHQRPKSIERIHLSEIERLIVIVDPDSKINPLSTIEIPELKTTRWEIINPTSISVTTPEDHMRKFRKVRDDIRKKILNLRASNKIW